jgi:hypothetical protein
MVFYNVFQACGFAFLKVPAESEGEGEVLQRNLQLDWAWFILVCSLVARKFLTQEFGYPEKARESQFKPVLLLHHH